MAGLRAKGKMRLEMPYQKPEITGILRFDNVRRSSYNPIVRTNY